MYVPVCYIRVWSDCFSEQIVVYFTVYMHTHLPCAIFLGVRNRFQNKTGENETEYYMKTFSGPARTFFTNCRGLWDWKFRRPRDRAHASDRRPPRNNTYTTGVAPRFGRDRGRSAVSRARKYNARTWRPRLRYVFRSKFYGFVHRFATTTAWY